MSVLYSDTIGWLAIEYLYIEIPHGQYQKIPYTAMIGLKSLNHGINT